MIVTPSFYNGISRSERVGTKQYAGIITVASKHTKVKGNIFLISIFADDLIQFTQAGDRRQSLCIISHTLCLIEHFDVSKHLRKAFEQVRQLFIHVPLFKQCLDTEIVFVGDQSAKFLLGSFVNTGLCKQALEELYMSDAHLKFGKSGCQQHLYDHCRDLGIGFHAAVPDQLRTELCHFF